MALSAHLPTQWLLRSAAHKPPAKQVPENAKTGDELEVFLYKDTKDRMIATTNQPKITLGGLAVLRVAQVGKIGAFLDWGLEKDLFLPYKEMTMKVQPED